MALFRNIRLWSTFGSRSGLLSRTYAESTQPSKALDEGLDDLPITMEDPFQEEKPVCILCKHKITPDFKNTRLLSQFVSPFTGKLYGRHITGLCKQKQNKLEKELDKAVRSGFMSSYYKQPIYFNDPKLYDPNKPLKPHNF